MLPRSSNLPHEPTALKRLAELAGIDADELRALLREEIEDAEHRLMQAVLAEAWAASASVARVRTVPRPHRDHTSSAFSGVASRAYGAPIVTASGELCTAFCTDLR